MYKMAFIGCGKRAAQHIPGVQADPRCQVVAATDIREEAAQALLAGGGIDANIYTDHRVMLKQEKPDVVITALWTGLHLPIFRDCVDAGVKAVLCEKPMAGTWGDCLEMGRLADEHGTILTFCHQRRFSSGNQLIRRELAQGRFGKIERMDLYSPKSLLDCGTHSIDQAMSFNQESPAKWVLGAIDTEDLFTSFGLPSDTHATGLIVFENNVRAHIWCGGPDQDMYTGVRVIGSEGFFETGWAGGFDRAVVYNDPTWKPPVANKVEHEEMIGVVSNAIDCLNSGDEPELSYRKALRSNEIIYALYESARSRRRVHLPLQIQGNPLAEMIETGEVAQPA